MNYWQEREAKAQEKLTNKSIKQTEAQLRKYYKTSFQRSLDNFEKVYNKILQDTVKGKDITPADLYKLDKYWQLQGELKVELQKLGDRQVALLSKQFEEQYIKIYESIALKGDDAFHQMDRAQAKQMINRIWCADGKSWSQRVWTNTDKLQQALNEELINCLLAGEKTTGLKKRLMREFNVAYSRADSIVRTEMAHLQTQAAQERYRDYGISEVEVLVDGDERTCDICSGLKGKRFPINGTMPVPAHPRCRCCIVPVVKE